MTINKADVFSTYVACSKVGSAKGLHTLAPTGKSTNVAYRIIKFCVGFSSQERSTLAFSRIIHFNIKHHH
jgi:hypothetical protein